MSSSKVFNTFLLYAIIPVFIAVYANKVSFLAAIDLVVWLAALVALFNLVKTPWELYYLAKTKSFELEAKKKRGGSIQQDAMELANLEIKMFYTAWATPFAAIIGWYVLAEFCGRYRLHSMTELVHPYFVLLIGIGAGFLPVQQFREKMKKRIASVDSNEPLYNLLQTQTRNNAPLVNADEPTRKLQEEVAACHLFNNKLDQELKLLRREMKSFAMKKNEDILKLERKVIGLENQVELMQIIRKENVNEKGILDALVTSPLKMLGIKS